MKKICKNITLLNVITGFLLQFLTICSGFIIPRIILSNFGSDVNGLITSITHLLGYISLVEGGITGVVMANLYKPLVNKEKEKISSIIATAGNFYKKISIIFVIYTLLLAILYLFIFRVDFSFIYIFTLTLILSLNLFVQYAFSLSLKTLLNADKKAYIVNLTQSFITILNLVLSIIIVNIFPNIHFLKGISGVLFFIQIFVYRHYVNKHYNLNKNVSINNNLIKSRWNGFAINMAAFIHNSTDTIILSFFLNLKYVSIYSVYSLVTNGLKQLINSIINSITPNIGQLYAKGNMNDLNHKFDIVEFVNFFLVSFFFGIASLLITPFVMIYTKSINDANYYQPLFSTILLLAEAIYLIRLPYLNLAYAANKFKEITIPSYIEAGINIIISIVLVRRFKLIGVLIGTLFAMLYRLIFHVHFSKKLINRDCSKFYFKFFIFFVTVILSVSLCKLVINISTYNIFNWIYAGIIYSIIMLVTLSLVSLIFFRKELKFFYTFIGKGNK